MKEMLANKLARDISKPFAELEAHMQQTLKGYGITPEVWELLKSGDLLKTPSNRVYLTSRITDSIDQRGIEALQRSTGAMAKDAKPDAVQKAIAGFRSDLSDKLGMWMPLTTLWWRPACANKHSSKASSPRLGTERNAAHNSGCWPHCTRNWRESITRAW